MARLFLYLFLTAMVLSSCKTNPPTAPTTTPQEYGKISVTCNVDSAKIFIDDINTGKITPAIILASIGNHLIRLEKDNYVSEAKNITVEKDSIMDVSFTLKHALGDKIVLIEDFANVSCNPCVTSNKILESLKQSFGSKKILIIKYPTNFPSPSDPFYLANTADCNARMSFYNILVAPTTKVDGYLTPVSTDSISVNEEIIGRITLLPKFKITVSDSFGIGNYNIRVKLETIDTTGINFSDFVLHTVVIESIIEFSTPPGSNGETKFYDVMRKMLPSSDGEALTYSASGTQYHNRQVAINPTWNSSKLEAIAFIQNKITKEILQAGGTVVYN